MTTLDLPVEGETDWDEKLNAALYDLEERVAAASLRNGPIHLNAFHEFFAGPWGWINGQGDGTATTTTAARAAGNTTIPVASTAGLLVGMALVMGEGTPQQQMVVITNIAGLTLTIDNGNAAGNGLLYPLANGQAVTPFWRDIYHPTQAGALAYGYFIANAKDDNGAYIIQGAAPKVVYLGDSWMDPTSYAGDYIGTYSGPLTDRIPAATGIEAGVSGNRAQDLLARFDADVPGDTDYVVVPEPGTNDLAWHFGITETMAWLDALWRKATAIGAKLIWTGYVPQMAFMAHAEIVEAQARAAFEAGTFPLITAEALDAMVPIPMSAPADGNIGIGRGALRSVSPTDGVDTFNTVIGFVAGYRLTDGAGNVALGWLSLWSAEDVDGNTAIGTSALQMSETDFGTAVGYQALANATTAALNTALGALAGYSLTTGGGNTLVGYEAMQYNETGIQNTAVGALALQAATADLNTAVGYQAATALTTGDGNTFLGYLAGYSIGPTGDEDKATTTEIDQTIVGRQAGGQGSLTVVVGAYSEASEDKAVVVGPLANALGEHSIAMGAFTTADADGSVAIGTDSDGSAAQSWNADEIVLGTTKHKTFIPGRLNIAASHAARGAGLNLADGVAPAAPANGDMWRVGDLIYVRLGGATLKLYAYA